MTPALLRSLEFDRVAAAVRSLAVTPLGAVRLASLEPYTELEAARAALDATTETARYLAAHPLFPLRAGDGLDEAIATLGIEGRLLEPRPLRGLADFVASIAEAHRAVVAAPGVYPILEALVGRLAPFDAEVAAVHHAIDEAGELLDRASPALGRIRDRLRAQRQALRSTLERFIRGRDTAKYLQEQVVTVRNGRFVLMVRAEHKGAVPGIVHGASTSGASLFLEPLSTVELNNDIVALEEAELEEVRRILLELTDRFRQRPGDLRVAFGVAETLDVLQAKARLSALVGGIAPRLTAAGPLELRQARHPLLIRAVTERIATEDEPPSDTTPVPVELVLEPPHRVLLITGPNTGGKTVALKTAGLLALMAQAGLHIPADPSSTLPVFRTVFADIGDEQSIANSLSTFSGHIANIVGIDRGMQLPCLVLLDEVGTGTDPAEGGALATAIIHHFRQRGALVLATTHYDQLKTWGTTTDGVVTAAFAFDPQTFAPTYRLVYGAPGRSLALEIAQRLGLPLPVIAAARGHLSDDRKRLDAHLARVDAQARALDTERRALERQTAALQQQGRALDAREQALAEREGRFARRLDEKLDDRLRQARRDIDAVVARLRERADQLVEEASARTRAVPIPTGVTGAARAEAQAEVDRIVGELRAPADAAPETTAPAPPAAPLAPGVRVSVGGLGVEGVVVALHGAQAEVDVRGKRLRAAAADLHVIAAPARMPAPVRVSVQLQPRESLTHELNVIGCTVSDAVDRVSRFLDDALVTDAHELRIVHGHGTGQLRRGLHAFLKDHPLVARVDTAPGSQGGGGATLVTLKD